METDKMRSRALFFVRLLVIAALVIVLLLIALFAIAAQKPSANIMDAMALAFALVLFVGVGAVVGCAVGLIDRGRGQRPVYALAGSGGAIVAAWAASELALWHGEVGIGFATTALGALASALLVLLLQRHLPHLQYT